MKYKIITILFVLISILATILVSNEIMVEKKKPISCEGRQWGNSKKQLDCLYPNPPYGRWKAVYTKAFAETHNLPLENVSTDLSPNVDYMEMDVQPYATDGTACLVNMLIKKPNDVAVFNMGRSPFSWGPQLHNQRKLSHFINLEDNKEKLKDITTFTIASRDYDYKTKGMGGGTIFAFHAEDVLEGYDYITANAQCRIISMKAKYFPDNFAFWVLKASVWGRNETPYRSHNNPKTPKGMDFYNSHLFINIPYELLTEIYKDVPIGGQN